MVEKEAMNAHDTVTDTISIDEKLSQLPSISIVVEWENNLLAELRRTEQMLHQLGSQLRGLNDRFEQAPELIVVYDPEEAERTEIDQTLATYFDAPDEVSVRVIEAEGENYYQIKNVGARTSTNEVVVFLDSDVIPEGDWLENLLTPFAADDDADGVRGNTYLDTHSGSLYAKAMSLFWIFPPTKDQEKYSGLYANNCAFKRSTFREYEFPESPKYRGPCWQLNHDLEQDGKRIYDQESALTAHPAPNGVSHFVNRAVCNGHDQDFAYRIGAADRTFPSELVHAVSSFSRNLFTAGKRIRKNKTNYGADDTVVAASVLLGFTYYLVSFLGQIATAIDPDWVEQHFEI